MRRDTTTTEIATAQGRFTADVAGDKDGALVVLLHGFPQTRYTWRDALPALADAGFYAVAPDQRGYSAGVRPPAIEDYTTDRLVADVLDIVDVLGAERAHVVGHDWGGQIAWLTAAHHPHRLESLTVLSRPHPAAFSRSFAVDPEQATRSRHHRAMGPEATDRWWANGGEGLRTILARAGVPPADVDAYASGFAERAAMDAAINWYRAAALTNGLQMADCPAVTVPTLYLWGTADQSVGRTAAELTAQYVDAPYRFVEIAGAGHFLTDDGAADRVVAELVTHLTAAR